MTSLAKSIGRERYRTLRDAVTNFSLMLGILIVILIVLVVLFGPMLAPYNPYLVDRIVIPHYDFEEKVYIRVPLKPDADFPLGTNELGMDMLSLLLHGARNTLVAGVLIAGARVILGLFIGLVAGWFEGGLFDRAVVGAIGVLNSLPLLISGMILIFAIGIGGGIVTFFIALTAVGWTEVAQYIRGEVLVARKMPYMEAARSIGLREVEIAIRHVIPNILPQVFVISFLEIGAVLMLLGELALIGVFIGGGSSLDFSDIMSPPNIVAIPTQPEWGAMIANGFRWLRSYPHIVFVPATAVFLAVLGFNAIGEGLRSLFEKRGIKTSFIVSRRMLLVLAVVFLVMFTIFQSTQPVHYFQELARSFSNQEVALDAEILAGLDGFAPAPGQPAPKAAYIGAQLKDFGFKGAIRWSNFFHLRSENLYEPAWTPQLQMLDENGAATQTFAYGSDFAYVLDDYGGAGDVTARLALMRVWPDLDSEAFAHLGNRSFEGQIVMVEEGNVPAEMAQALVQRGAAGVLWVVQPGTPLRDSRLASMPSEEGNPPLTAPVFRVSRATAEALLSSTGLSLAAFEQPPGDAASESLPPAVLLTDLQLRMQLGFKDPVPIEITDVAAYFQGTDADLGDEIILFVLACDGLWRADQPVSIPENYTPQACMAPLPIEFGRMLNEAVIDLKRPIMVLVWGGGEFSYSGLSEWLTDHDNFGHLSAPGLRLQPRPVLLFELESTQSQGATLEVSPEMDDELRKVLGRAATWGDVELVEADGSPNLPIWISSDVIPFQSVLGLNLEGDQTQQVGEGFSLALIRMLRETILNGD